MIYIKYIFLLSLLGSLAAGCTTDPVQSERKAVIEGYICSGETPLVIFSSSIVPEISGNISDAVINWGRVSVSDGDTTVLLTGRVDDSYLPPFVYYTFDIKGIPGKTYSVTADFKDLHASAVVRMPEPTPIDSITLKATDNDSVRAATLHFTSPSDVPAYYYLTLRRNERGSERHPCMMGTLIADKPLTHYSLPIFRPRVRIESTSHKVNLEVGEQWTVGLNRLEKDVYEFWKAYDDMVMFSASPFISTNASLPTNIAGGYGIWSVEGSSTMELNVE